MFGWELGIKKFVKNELRFRATSIPSSDLHGVGSILERKGKEYSIIAGGNQGFNSNLFISNINDMDIALRPLNIPLQNGLGSNFTRASAGRKHVWLGSWAGGAYGFRLKDNSDISWTTDIITYTHDEGNPYTIIENGSPVVVEDSLGKVLWIGGYTGLNKVYLDAAYGTEGSVEHFKHNPNDSNSISKGTVRKIVVGNGGGIWIATESGLDYLEGQKVTHVISGEAIADLFKPNNREIFVGGSSLYKVNTSDFNVTAIGAFETGMMVVDKLGNFWIGNNRGLSRYDTISKGLINFYAELGDISGMVISKRGIIQVTNNDNLLITIDPLSFSPSPFQVFPMLTNLWVNNLNPAIRGGDDISSDEFSISTSIVKLEVLKLDYHHNNFSVEFSAMEMTAPENNRYRHKLDGFDPDWIETDSKNRTATYTNLPAGTYTFRVKASNHHGVWSDNERTMQVIILPPPWRTWWAYTGYGLLVTGLLVWARRNIVQRERLKSNLALAKVEQEREHFELEKAKEVDRVKTSFFTNISHEFRTPLTLIKGPVADMLDEYGNDGKTNERLKLIQRNSDLLLRLINQLLDLAKLESGTLKVEKSEGEVYSFVRAIASSFESLARQKGIVLTVEVPMEDRQAWFDKDKLETILVNLVNNAIKFTPSGGTVAVSSALSLDANILCLTVKDTGIGIPEGQQAKIFERFHQVSEAHKEVGTGIGLALVKELVSLMGGTIKVSSEVGKGSEFIVGIPLDLVVSYQPVHRSFSAGGPLVASNLDEPLETSRPATIDNGEPAKPHILVVEDNTDLRHFIMDSLGGEFVFLEAGDGKEGLEKATAEIPDMIISDVMMPEMDGITMAERIKADFRTCHVPLILLTAKSTEGSKLEGLKRGADDYLTKPFNKQELLLKVRNGVKRQQKLREKLRAELMSDTPKVEVISEDERFMVKVKETILNHIGDEQLSVESLAEEIGFSRVHLYRKVNGLIGMSVNELIRKLRLQRAAQLLQQEWGSVSQVAYEVGFSNLSYFSKVFKEEFGMLPSEYGGIARTD